jgi:acetate kinase
MNDAILAINAGSSSIKFAVFLPSNENELHRYVSGKVKGIGAQASFAASVVTAGEHAQLMHSNIAAADHAQALQHILEWLTAKTAGLRLVAGGHRVVHGGTDFTQAVRIDARVLAALHALTPLAPLHQPHALHAIEALMKQQPQLAHVACFDTAFHANMPAHEQHFALPRTLEQQGIRRYGFHGLSYEYITSVLPDSLGDQADAKVVIAHLGHGVSMCAVTQRRSIATTMSFTPLDGLPMGTRSGALDPAIVLYLLEQGMSAQQISSLLHRQSGLLGLSGLSDDMQTLLASSQAQAVEAVEYFCYHISRELGSLAAALGGLDALIFTGGIGEQAATVRACICDAAAWLGVRLDTSANLANAVEISASDSEVSVWVIPTDEEVMIARHTLTTISKTTATSARRSDN